MTTSCPVVSVRLLNGLEVTRGDGSVVDRRAWCTGKTMDLLRILALENGRPVRVTALVHLLWPDVDPERGRGSLRTAASLIRRAVRHDCIERQHGGLALVSAVVDVEEYRDLAAAASRASVRQQHDEVLRLTAAAEAVYSSDFHAYDDEAGWAVHARRDLAQLRLGVLTQATACALALQRFRDAVDLSRAAVAVDPSSETAHRGLMQSLAELGEVGQALHVFEGYRARLAEELGIDPSRTTRDLRQQILQERRT